LKIGEKSYRKSRFLAILAPIDDFGRN